MKFLPLTMALILAVTATSVTGFQMSPPGGGGAVNWKFTNPLNGMQCYSDVLFLGTGPANSTGASSVYSYDNQVPGGVYASELTLQVSVLVDTDPGFDWVGTTWSQKGLYYATVMPALESLNMALLSLTNPGGGEVTTLTQVSGGDGILFSIVDP